MENMKEMNLNELESAVGGKGGSRTVLPSKAGCIVYQIESGDNLTKIAKWYGVTVKQIMNTNVGIIKNANDITAGYYIYIPQP